MYCILIDSDKTYQNLDKMFVFFSLKMPRVCYHEACIFLPNMSIDSNALARFTVSDVTSLYTHYCQIMYYY